MNSSPAHRAQLKYIRAERWYTSYNALVLPLLPAVGAYTLWRRYGRGKSAGSFRGQWGKLADDAVEALRAGDPTAPRVWLHAVSVGEQVAARPLLRALRKEIPHVRLALSVTTDTGHDTAQVALRAGEADALFYLPIDIPFAIRRALNVIRPSAFLTVETELWPNLLHIVHGSGAKTFLVNGRISDRTLNRAPRMGWIWRWMLANLDGMLMRSEFDAARIKSLGADPAKVRAVGDVKLDAVAPGETDASALRRQWRARLGVLPGALLIVAGSTHPGEETAVVHAYLELRNEFPTLRLVIAPRHIERVAEVAALLAPAHRVALRSELDGNLAETESERPIVLLDSVGELSQLYAAADVAFVGGSLIARGGHNMLEPAQRGVPVAFGPHIDNFREAATLIENARIGSRVRDSDSLALLLGSWLRDRHALEEIKLRATEALAEHRGAATRIARVVAESLAVPATTDPSLPNGRLV